PYRILVLDSDTNLSVRVLVNKDKLAMGYLSLTELKDTEAYFIAAREQDLLLEENGNWKDTHGVDIRNPLWARYLIEQAIPRLLHLGFNGLMLDGLDNAAAWENADPKNYGGMKDAAIRLVQAIRMHYPDIALM